MRCFLAIELPQAVHDRLADLQSQLRPLGRAVRWTRPEQIHLTVKFLGEVPDAQIAAVCETAAQVAKQCQPFELRVEGTGCFPPGGAARVLWAGLPDAPKELLECHRACESAFAKLGFPPENRAFHPHLTVARVKEFAASDRIRAALRAQGKFAGGSFEVRELVMFQSTLAGSGPTHAVLSRAVLGGVE